MRNLVLIISLSTCLIFASCSSNNVTEKVADSDIEFQFEIVDSLLLDYLGTPLLCDFSPNKERILFYNGRNTEFIITDASGEILNQFSKEGDIPDNPGTLADRPIFYNDSTIIAHGQKGIWAYNFVGENVLKIEREKSLGFWFSKTFSRSMYLLDPNEYFTVINYDQLVINASNDSLYENQTALKIVNGQTKSIKPTIPLESFSRYLDGNGYQPASMLPSNHVNKNTMVLSYSKEDLIYLYEWKDQTFQLADTFSLGIEPFFLDQGKDRESFEGQNGFSMGGKVGEADVRGVWLVNDNQVLVQYNAGIKESERLEPKMEKIGENSMRMVNPDNIPDDKFQLYKDTEKYGISFSSSKALSSLLYIDGDFIWFRKNNEALGVEDDYAVFYKTKLSRKP
jgi:hypothetical protein